MKVYNFCVVLFNVCISGAKRTGMCFDVTISTFFQLLDVPEINRGVYYFFLNDLSSQTTTSINEVLSIMAGYVL